MSLASSHPNITSDERDIELGNADPKWYVMGWAEPTTVTVPTPELWLCQKSHADVLPTHQGSPIPLLPSHRVQCEYMVCSPQSAPPLPLSSSPSSNPNRMLRRESDPLSLNRSIALPQKACSSVHNHQFSPPSHSPLCSGPPLSC